MGVYYQRFANVVFVCALDPEAAVAPGGINHTFASDVSQGIVSGSAFFIQAVSRRLCFVFDQHVDHLLTVLFLCFPVARINTPPCPFTVISASNPTTARPTSVPIGAWVWSIPVGVLLLAALPVALRIVGRHRRRARLSRLDAMHRKSPSHTQSAAGGSDVSMVGPLLRGLGPFEPAEGLTVGPLLGRGGYGRVYKCRLARLTFFFLDMHTILVPCMCHACTGRSMPCAC